MTSVKQKQTPIIVSPSKYYKMVSSDMIHFEKGQEGIRSIPHYAGKMLVIKARARSEV